MDENENVPETEEDAGTYILLKGTVGSGKATWEEARQLEMDMKLMARWNHQTQIFWVKAKLVQKE